MLAEVLIYESFKSDSAVQQICMHHPDHWNFAFCLDLYSSLNCYHQIPGNIFDLTEENDFAVFNDLMQVNVDTISEKAFDFYIDQLNKKLEVCRDEDCKLYDTVRSKAVSSRNKSVKQNEKMVKAQQRTIECSSSNDDVNENDHSEGFFKQGKKIFENLFKGRK